MVKYIHTYDRGYNSRVIYMFICPLSYVYVGYASKFAKRIRGHRHESYKKKDGTYVKNSRWMQAVRHHGWKNLSVVILEYVSEDVYLLERERYWIKRMKSNNPKFGYNSNAGGGGCGSEESRAKLRIINSIPVTRCEILEDYGTTQKVILTSYESAKAAEQKMHISHVTECCKKKRQSIGGYLWWYTTSSDIFNTPLVLPHVGYVQNVRTAIKSVFPLGNGKAEEQYYSNMSEAARTLSTMTGKKFQSGHIAACCNGYSTSHHGHHFVRTTEVKEDFRNGKRVVKYELNRYVKSKKRKRY